MPEREGNNPWQARAEALLGIAQAALAITDGAYLITDDVGRVVVGRDRYERLVAALDAYRVAAEREEVRRA